MDVQDKPAEIGIKLNNILTFLVLAVMSWVGYNIQAMKDEIVRNRIDSSINRNDLQHMKDRLDNHLREWQRVLEEGRYRRRDKK